MKAMPSNVLNKVRNGEFLQFAKIMINMYDQNKANELQLTDRLAALQNAVNELETVYQNSTAHVLTPELKDADFKRTNLLRAIRKIVESYLLTGEDFAKPADLLLNNYQLHAGKIKKLSLTQITANIDALLDDWNVMTYFPEAVEKLGLQGWMLKLQVSNKEFDDLYVKRIQTTQQAARITDKRAMIKTLLDELIQDTEAHFRLAADNKPYATILENVNTLIVKHSNLISSRYADRKKEKAPEQVTNSYLAEVVY